MKQKIKSIVDQVIVKQDYREQETLLEEMLNLVVPYALQDYSSCRDIIQATIGQLERVGSITVPFLFNMISSNLDSYAVEGERPAFLKYVDSDIVDDKIDLINRIEPYLPKGKCVIHELNMPIAEALTAEEQRYLVSVFTHTIQVYGEKMQWTDDMCQNALLICYVLYPICKINGVLSLLFHVSNNLIDRLITSVNNQAARDFTESMLTIGYNEQMVAEGYFSACRTYTGAGNLIAGLLFYHICLYSIKATGRIVNTRFAFDLCWQYLKLCRLCGICPQNDIERVKAVVKQLPCEDYERIWFYHTYYSTQLIANAPRRLIEDVKSFLDLNRETFFSQLNHGAMPWLSLIFGMQELIPDGDFSGLIPYAKAASQVVEIEGNTLYLDLFEENKLAIHLRELQYNLLATRNRSDYSMDNRLAMMVSKKLVSQAFNEKNVTDFLLAMTTRTDFSTVLPSREMDENYIQFSLAEARGEKLRSFLFDNLGILPELLTLEENDVIVWMGRGKKDYHLLSLQNSEYKWLGIVPGLSNQDRKSLEVRLKGIKFVMDSYKEGQPVYVKSDQDFAKENDELKEALKSFSFAVPSSAKRLVLMKDIEISSYPHNLFVDLDTGNFLGELYPTCTGISTEVLFKTNTYAPLSKDYTKSFWIPRGSDELTFDMIYDKLEDVIRRHHISVQNELNQDKPLIGDMTLLCAHGGENISSTELFYIDDKPILDTLRYVSSGKIAIMLICYSGTISQSNYDNAMHTLIKKMLLKGYSSVVAPMWSLATNIIAPWLSVFMDSIEKGDYIIDAVYQANMEVKKEYKSAAAWACLHLFGNPYMQIADSPRVSFETEGQELS